MDDVDAEAPQAMRSAVVRAKHEAIRSASVVLLSGFLESFLRECAEVFFDELVRRGLAFAKLPEKMRQHHFVAGLDEVLKIAKKDSVDTFANTLACIGRLLHAPTNGASGLYWEAFAATRGNPGPEVIATYLRNFAVKEPMARVASAINRPESFLKLSLSSFIELRNECAHTGRTKNTPQPSEIRDFVQLLRLLTLAITKVLDKQISELSASAAAA